MSGEKQPIIRLRGIVKRFYIGQPNELEILHGIDLDVNEGEFVAIVGESGSGKSTLMNIVGALDKPTQGSYLLDGIDMTAAKDGELSALRCRKIGFVFQTFNLIGRTSALKNVELPMLYNGVGAAKRTARAKVPDPFYRIRRKNATDGRENFPARKVTFAGRGSKTPSCGPGGG